MAEVQVDRYSQRIFEQKLSLLVSTAIWNSNAQTRIDEVKDEVRESALRMAEGAVRMAQHGHGAGTGGERETV